MAFSYGWRGPNIVRDGLILYLDAASPNSYYPTVGGTIWRDISKSFRNATLTNGPTYSSTNSGSFLFDGTNDYADLGNIIYTDTTSTTLDIWVNFQSFVLNDSVLTKGSQASGTDTTFAAWITTSNRVTFRAYNSSNVAGLVVTGTLVTGSWYNLVWTYDGTTLSSYTNGALSSGGGSTPPASLASPLKNSTYAIRIASDTFSRSANMFCSVFKIYSRALTPQEISYNFNLIKSRYGL